MRTRHSPTLAIDETVNRLRAAGKTVLHLGFGEAGLPVPPGLTEVLAAAADDNRYGSTIGSEAARDAAAGWFSRRGVRTCADQIVYAPGSKPLLFAVLAAIDGPVILPRPAWVTYEAQTMLLGRELLTVPIPDSCGGIPDPDRLAATLRSRTVRDGVLVLTIPDNPTGTVADVELLQRVCAVAEQHGLAIICDEIYAELCHRGSSPSATWFLPERTVTTSGLSKSHALGGWRIGFARTPDNPWGRNLMRTIIGVGSEVWSTLAAPMQPVAAHVLQEPDDLGEIVAAAKRLHGRVATAIHSTLIATGAACRAPQAGFYLYPDFGPLRSVLAERGITTGEELATVLLEEHGIATLPGSAFGDDSSALTLRIATSLVYGTSIEQRWQALASEDPVALPWISDALNLFEDAVRRIATPTGRRFRP